MDKFKWMVQIHIWRLNLHRWWNQNLSMFDDHIPTFPIYIHSLCQFVLVNLYPHSLLVQFHLFAPKIQFLLVHISFFLVKSPFFMIKHIVSHIVSLDPPKFVPFLPLFHGFSRTSKESPGRCGWWSMPSGRGRRGDVRRGTPPVISWFINHSKYRYIYHKP